MGGMTLSLPDGLCGRARREAAAHRPRGAEIIRKTHSQSEAICRLGALGTGTYPPWTRMLILAAFLFKPNLGILLLPDVWGCS